MEIVKFYNFFPTKAQEVATENQWQQAHFTHEAVIRAGDPLLLSLFRNERDKWKIRKILTASDVGKLYRLAIPKKDVEEHILRFWGERERRFAQAGVDVHVCIHDMDIDSRHGLVMKRWIKSGTYIIRSNWEREFVKRRGLEVGDEIGLFWDETSSSLCFSVLNSSSCILPTI